MIEIKKKQKRITSDAITLKIFTLWTLWNTNIDALTNTLTSMIV